MQPNLPPEIIVRYRPAKGNDARAESFGLLKAARLNSESDWRDQRGTFDDQTIFGPRQRYACACGKYKGSKYANIICDVCGVQITTPDVRRERCAHINLTTEILHPLGGDKDHLSAVPVLPVRFVEAENGGDLLAAYDMILRATNESKTSDGFGRLLDVLSPVLVTAHRWDLADRLLVAHGMALIDRTA